MYEKASPAASTPLRDPAFVTAGLRAELVSRLTGLSRSRLRYWHATDLLLARARPGGPGIPRLYNWVDYLRLRVAADLADRVPTRRIREAIAYLDDHYPEWYWLPIRAEAGHVRVEPSGTDSALWADRHGQRLIALEFPEEQAEIAVPTRRALLRLVQQGPLGQLSEFEDAVSMDPRVNLGLPVLRGTSLETEFVSKVVQDMGLKPFAELYHLDQHLVTRAIEFEAAAA